MEIDKIKLFLFDMDGTIYLGKRLFDFTLPLLSEIKRQGKRYVFITNNASKNVRDYVSHLVSMGVEATSEDFVTSAQVTTMYLKDNFADKLIYSAGTRSFKDGLREAGLNITERYDENVEVVVNAYDTELTFEKLDSICRLLTEKKDIPYIATNPDVVCPTEYGYVPDCGSVSDMIFNATGRRPKFIGKPYPEIIWHAMKMAGAESDETLVIGDRIYTDIASGIKAGVKTALVLSGETTMEIAEKSDEKPTYILNDAGEILRELRELGI